MAGRHTRHTRRTHEADDRLATYAGRRDFARSPEPSGRARAARRGGPMFVIQQHDARRRHWDFRLEVDGVLRSWAVPKGPSTDPREQRLAVATEDHPLAYAAFEGVIPAGEYGAGAVIVWDAGRYHNRSVDGRGEPLPIADALARGKAVVWLEGSKLRGGYVLVHTSLRGDPRNWLLRKLRDEGADARRNPVSTQPRSVLSGRTTREVAAGA